MYCPKCSQQQSSETMRFCPKCGFALAGVAMLIESDGVIPQLTGGAPSRRSSRKKVMTESIILTGISWAILIIATLMFDFGGPFELMAKIAALIFFFVGIIGLLRLLHGFLFVKDTVDQPAYSPDRKAFTNQPQPLGIETPNRAALNPQRESVTTDYPRRQHTQEMVERPSVTENTTRLLQDPPAD
jgi:hypothetical protein